MYLTFAGHVTGLRIGIAYTMWNDKVINSLVDGCKKKLVECGVAETDIVTLQALELQPERRFRYHFAFRRPRGRTSCPTPCRVWSLLINSTPSWP